MRRKSATANQAPRNRKPDYSQKPHQHVLVAKHGSKWRQMVCSMPGCKYSEYWDGSRYRPFNVTPCGSMIGSERLEQQARDAIRPHSLWEELGEWEDEVNA